MTTVALPELEIPTLEPGTADIVHGDCLEVMRAFDDDTFDLTFCSPPYEAARLYAELGFKLRGQDWVDWAVERYLECVRVTRGLVVWVVEGQTRDFRWSATPALLMADLHRAGVRLRKPPVFHRYGIPGSGGPDWWRNDYEFCVCSSKGKLPWSDNTATGKPPKYASGGGATHRRVDGTRVKAKAYARPKIANPGNVVSGLRSLSIADMLVRYADTQKTSADSILRDLRQAVDAQEVRRWWAGVVARVCEASILQPGLQRGGSAQAGPDQRDCGEGPEAGPDENGQGRVRAVRHVPEAGGASPGRGPDEQQPGEPGGALHDLPQEGAQDRGVFRERVYEALLGSRILLAALPAIQEVWESSGEAAVPSLGASEGSNLIHCKVGKGHMGSALSHLSEAPFPESLVEPYVRCFCPPGGLVLDNFCGSGTTLAVATRLGRHAVGVDLRESQVELSGRRLEEVGA